eukprot:3555513-Rhodomonas_salina.1
MPNTAGVAGLTRVGQQQRPQDVGVHGSGKAFPHCGERCWFAGFPACNLPHIARCSFWTLANTSKSAVLVASETLWCADSLKSSRRSQGRSTTSFMDAERPFRSESKNTAMQTRLSAQALRPHPHLPHISRSLIFSLLLAPSLARFPFLRFSLFPSSSGLKFLDLGSGSGRDCYVAAALVGEKGSVTGIDMTAEQLKVSLNVL